NYGDINDPNFSLGNRSFKVALIEGSSILSMQNPFNVDGNGKKVSGYIDMAGSVNNPNAAAPDHIFGYETAPARNSASEAIRRKNLTDTDDNSVDFIAARYASGSGGMTNDILEVCYPRNAKDNPDGWDPFAAPTPPPGTEMLMILQIGAATDGNINRSFIELYNNTNIPINLSGYSVQYAAGFRSTNTAGSDPAATIDADGPWHVINLTGTLQPRHSYLILGQAMVSIEANGPALTFADGYGDINMTFNDPHLSNRSIKVVLMSNTTQLTVQNPFTGNSGAPVNGYMDMVGAINTANTDYIQGYEGALIIGLSKQGGQRRANLEDTNNNSTDFTRILFATVSAVELERCRPKNQAFGAWDPYTGATIE
ncbi:MAG: lamin tail domain-containing protein, partial [Treponema sp.]|nr:lamin tail domain-containing protein [Treponema sp.]